MLIRTLLLLALITIPCYAQSPCGPNGCPPRSTVVNVSEKVKNAVVLVGCSYPDGRRTTTDYGTGCIVGARNNCAYVLTCWHTFRDSGGRWKPFVTINGSNYEACFERYNRADDLALLRITNPNIEPLGIAATINCNDNVFTVGFAKARIRTLVRGRILSKVLGKNLVVSGSIKEGMSGAPLLNTNEEVVGVCWGTSDGFYCTPLWKIRVFLKGFFFLSEKPTPVDPPLPVDPPTQPEDPPLPENPVEPPDYCRELEIRIQRNETNIEAINRNIDKLVSNQKELQSKVSQLGLSVQSNSGNIESNKKNIENHTKAINELIAGQRELQNVTNNLDIKIQKNTNEIDNTNKELDNQNKKINDLITTQRETDNQIRQLLLSLEKITTINPGVGTGKARFRLWIDQNKVVKIEPQ